MKRLIFSVLIASLLVLTPSAQTATATYGTLISSLSTTSTGAVTGTKFAAPSPNTYLVSWAVVADGSALSVNLEGSLDDSTYFTLDSQTTAAGGLKNYGPTSVKFLRISAVSRTGGTSTTGKLVVARY